MANFFDEYDFNNIKKTKQEFNINTIKRAIVNRVIESDPSTELNIDELNTQLGSGNKEALKILDENQIPYTLAERDSGYTVKFSYNGTNYTIAYYAPSEAESPTSSNTKPQETSKPTTTPTEEIAETEESYSEPEITEFYDKDRLTGYYKLSNEEVEKYFEYREFKLQEREIKGYFLKNDIVINGENITSIGELLEALGKHDPEKYDIKTFYEKEQLMTAYGFTENEINQYFTYEKSEEYNTEGYVLKPDLIVNGELIYNISDLLKALGKEDEPVKTGAQGTTSVSASETSEAEAPDTDPRFDYSVVDDLNTPIIDLYNDNVEESDSILFKKIAANNQRYNVNGGGYDDVLREISNIKPQLTDYIKQKLEELGYASSYNSEVVDKFLNTFISEAVNSALKTTQMNSIVEGVGIKTGKYTSPIINSISPSYQSENPTTADVINYVIKLIDQKLVFLKPAASGSDSSTTNPDPFPKSYVESGDYLLDTADYFLSEDEIKLKEAISAAETGGTILTEDKNEVTEWIDIYSQRIRWTLQNQYPFISESHNSILNEAKNHVLNNIDNYRLDPPLDYIYNIGSILENYKEKSLELAQKKFEEKYA